MQLVISKCCIYSPMIAFANCMSGKYGLSYLLGKLMEEQFCQPRDLFVIVHNTDSKLTDLTFNFHHVIKNKVCQDLKCIPAHQSRLISEPVMQKHCKVPKWVMLLKIRAPDHTSTKAFPQVSIVNIETGYGPPTHILIREVRMFKQLVLQNIFLGSCFLHLKPWHQRKSLHLFCWKVSIK